MKRKVPVTILALCLLVAVFPMLLSPLSCTTTPFCDATKAGALMGAGRYEEALAEYTRAINLAPTYSTAYLGRGYAHQRLGDYEKALADYTKVIQLAPTDPEARVIRGRLYDLMDNPEQAIQDYSVAIVMKPSNANVYYYRGAAWEKLGNMQAAIKDFQVAAPLGQEESQDRLRVMGIG